MTDKSILVECDDSGEPVCMVFGNGKALEADGIKLRRYVPASPPAPEQAPGDQWRTAVERALGVEPDPIEHTPAWAYERVLAKREIGNGVRNESGPVEAPEQAPTGEEKEAWLAMARNARAGLQHAVDYDDEVAVLYNLIRWGYAKGLADAAELRLKVWELEQRILELEEGIANATEESRMYLLTKLRLEEWQRVVRVAARAGRGGFDVLEEANAAAERINHVDDAWCPDAASPVLNEEPGT